MKKTISTTSFVAMFLGISSIATAALDFNSIVVDDIEYYIQTDKSIYNLGENVEMLYRITNLGEEEVTFDFVKWPGWNLWVEKDGESVWRAVNAWTYAMATFTLNPGESVEFPDAPSHPYIWNMRDRGNDLVTAGTYTVIGGLDDVHWDYDHTKVSVPIEIVPEPATIFLFAFTGLLIRKNNRHKYQS